MSTLKNSGKGGGPMLENIRGGSRKTHQTIPLPTIKGENLGEVPKKNSQPVGTSEKYQQFARGTTC